MSEAPRRRLHRCAAIVLATWLFGGLALQAGDFGGTFLWGSSEDASEPGPSLLHDTSASFTWDGQAYSLYATHAPDATARQILEAAIAEIAPGLPIECFYRLTSGSWGDLAAAGLGDPRGAIPPSFSAGELRLRYYAPPAAGCPGVVSAGSLPTLFFAAFTHPSGRRLELRADWGESATSSPGVLTESSAEWRNGHLAFSLAVDGKPHGEGVVTAVARAIDPAFDERCHRAARELPDGELAAHGLHFPTVPPGFERVSSKQSAKLAPGGCPTGQADPGVLDLAWVFVSADNVALEVGVSRGAQAAVEAVKNRVQIGEDYVRWTDAQGQTYYVYGHSLDDGPGLSQAELFAVARSLDPSVQLPAR